MAYPLEYGDSPDTAAFNALNPPATFRELSIGQTFDFIDDSRPSYNSFYDRVRKVSARMYVSLQHPEYRYKVGTINARVYHVEAAS